MNASAGNHMAVFSEYGVLETEPVILETSSSYYPKLLAVLCELVLISCLTSGASVKEQYPPAGFVTIALTKFKPLFFH